VSRLAEYKQSRLPGWAFEKRWSDQKIPSRLAVTNSKLRGAAWPIAGRRRPTARSGQERAGPAISGSRASAWQARASVFLPERLEHARVVAAQEPISNLGFRFQDPFFGSSFRSKRLAVEKFFSHSPSVDAAKKRGAEGRVRDSLNLRCERYFLTLRPFEALDRLNRYPTHAHYSDED
jgi:hypothetical protein